MLFHRNAGGGPSTGCKPSGTNRGRKQGSGRAPTHQPRTPNPEGPPAGAIAPCCPWYMKEACQNCDDFSKSFRFNHLRKRWEWVGKRVGDRSRDGRVRFRTVPRCCRGAAPRRELGIPARHLAALGAHAGLSTELATRGQTPAALVRRCFRTGPFRPPGHTVMCGLQNVTFSLLPASSLLGPTDRMVMYVLQNVMFDLLFASPGLRPALLLGRIAMPMPSRRALPARCLAALWAYAGCQR